MTSAIKNTIFEKDRWYAMYAVCRIYGKSRSEATEQANSMMSETRPEVSKLEDLMLLLEAKTLDLRLKDEEIKAAANN